MKTLIAESGATKTDWRYGSRPARTAGINVAIMSGDDIKAIVSDAVSSLGIAAGEVEAVCFYAAGLVGGKQSSALTSVLGEIFPEAAIECHSDLMAASRALWSDSPGVVAILGTGSNSCSYDGREIVKNVRPGGFILGDEGGGVSLGKMFLADYVKNLLPPEISGKFEAEYGLGYAGIVEKVYHGETPSRFIASFAPFVLEAVSSSSYMLAMVETNFRNFIKRSLSAYKTGDGPLRVGVVGSFGYACQNILWSVGREYDVDFVKFIESPIDALYDYHLRYAHCPTPTQCHPDPATRHPDPDTMSS